MATADAAWSWFSPEWNFGTPTVTTGDLPSTRGVDDWADFRNFDPFFANPSSVDVLPRSLLASTPVPKRNTNHTVLDTFDPLQLTPTTVVKPTKQFDPTSFHVNLIGLDYRPIKSPFTATKTTSALTLRKDIGKHMSVDPDQLILVFSGWILHDDIPICLYGIQNGSHIVVLHNTEMKPTVDDDDHKEIDPLVNMRADDPWNPFAPDPALLAQEDPFEALAAPPNPFAAHQNPFADDDYFDDDAWNFDAPLRVPRIVPNEVVPRMPPIVQNGGGDLLDDLFGGALVDMLAEQGPRLNVDCGTQPTPHGGDDPLDANALGTSVQITQPGSPTSEPIEAVIIAIDGAAPEILVEFMSDCVWIHLVHDAARIVSPSAETLFEKWAEYVTDTRWLFTTDAPDMITLEADPSSPRYVMPCSHGITSDSLTSFVSHELSEGRCEIKCPESTCPITWEWRDIRSIVALSDGQAMHQLECMWAYVVVREKFDAQKCGQCGLLCFRTSQNSSMFQCPKCVVNESERHNCWNCRSIWANIQEPSCGDENCVSKMASEVLRILKQCPKKAVGSVSNVPETRACVHCGQLITHHRACKHMQCSMCKKRFCFVCLKPYVDNSWQCGNSSTVCPVAPVQTLGNSQKNRLDLNAEVRDAWTVSTFVQIYLADESKWVRTRIERVENRAGHIIYTVARGASFWHGDPHIRLPAAGDVGAVFDPLMSVSVSKNLDKSKTPGTSSTSRRPDGMFALDMQNPPNFLAEFSNFFA